MTAVPWNVTLQVIEALESEGADYVVVGSMASSSLGMPRSTLDSDLLAEVREACVPGLMRRLGSDFYLDDLALREAIRRKAMFNVVHLRTAFKVDVYVLGADSFDRSKLARRRLRPVEPTSTREVYVATPEDVVISKLRWYELGNRVSERQWKDLLGVMRAQPGIDTTYIATWAARLELTELLEEAMRQLAR